MGGMAPVHGAFGAGRSRCTFLTPSIGHPSSFGHFSRPLAPVALALSALRSLGFQIQIRISKSETNPNIESPNWTTCCFGFWVSRFEFVSDFVLRISNFR